MCVVLRLLKILNKKIKPTQMTMMNNHTNSSEENELMDQHEDSGEQTDSGISSTFTTDIEQMFAETVNNVSRAHSWPLSNRLSLSLLMMLLPVSCEQQSQLFIKQWT